MTATHSYILLHQSASGNRLQPGLSDLDTTHTRGLRHRLQLLRHSESVVVPSSFVLSARVFSCGTLMGQAAAYGQTLADERQ